MDQIQVWQLYTDTSPLYTWELSHIIPVWSKPPSTNQLASSCYLLYRRLEGSLSSVRPESWAELCVITACFQNLSQSLKRKFILLSSPALGGLKSGSVIDWNPCRADTQEKSGMIFQTSRTNKKNKKHVCCVFQLLGQIVFRLDNYRLIICLVLIHHE